jgi:dTDP-4-amino-4,6-dideoxygalactose transaminase
MDEAENFLIFGAPSIGQSEINEVIATLESGWLGTGPRVAQFERSFSDYKGVVHAAAVSSCTAALHLSMIAAGIRPGDEVITTAMTFCATVNAIIHTGATPIIVDIDPQTLNIDPTRIEQAITDRTKAIIPVHFAGYPCDMSRIMAMADKYHLKVIEDCAHAIETEWRGCKTGTIGDFGCFSFYVTKNITTGEGGLVLAKSETDIDRIKVMALHGLSGDAWQRFGDKGYKHYQVIECGFKYNMTDMSAAIGICQLSRIDGAWKRRREIWAHYNESLKDLPIKLPCDIPEGCRHGYHLYTVQIDETKTGLARDAFLQRMFEQGIGTGVHYVCLAEHPYYQQHYSWQPEDYAHATTAGRNTVSIPLAANLTDSDVERVVCAVRAALGDGCNGDP